jgi:hypothetical protein
MKFALTISGQLRRFDNAAIFATLNKFVLEPLQPDIFIHVWNKRGASKYSKSIGLHGNFENDIVTEQQIRNIFPTAKSIVVENYDEWFNNTDKRWLDKMNEPNSNPMWYKIFKCNELKSNFENEHKFEYDCVIRLRPDTIFYSPIPSEYFTNLNVLWNVNHLLRWNKSRVHDILFFANSAIMDKVANIWNVLPNYLHYNGAPYLLAAYCRENNITAKTFIDQSFFELDYEDIPAVNENKAFNLDVENNNLIKYIKDRILNENLKCGNVEDIFRQFDVRYHAYLRHFIYHDYIKIIDETIKWVY